MEHVYNALTASSTSSTCPSKRDFAPFLAQDAFSLNARMLVRLEVGKYHDAVITNHSHLCLKAVSQRWLHASSKMWSEQHRRCLHGLGLIAV